MSVKVAVRVRPLNAREKQAGAKSTLMMTGNQTWLYPKAQSSEPSSLAKIEEGTKKFTFDHSFWSCDSTDNHYVSQDMVFETLGKPLLEAVFKGYNTCLFAYGQTSAGKSYSMMGEAGNPGLIPRVSQALFERVVHEGDGGQETSFRAVVSYLEIYNERVRDLLVKTSATTLKAWSSGKDSVVGSSLKVREHPKTGPYVEGLTQHSVTTVKDIMELIERGNSNRTTAATLMNGLSSRSHSIFTINFSQATMVDGLPCEKSSRINLVDLAGSERVQSSGATGERLKEGASINKSLTTLGLVISNLATNSAAEAAVNAAKQKVKAFVPYRDSVLTWLLKDSLGGNAMTVMLAAISPADLNHGETLSTLRYAHRAKSIVNKPTVNEDQNVKLIRELRAEIALLRQQLPGSFQGGSAVNVALQSKLLQSEQLAASLTQTWEAKWEKTQKIIQERSLALTDSGVALHVESEQPYLIALAVDRLSTGVTICNLKEGVTTLGAAVDGSNPDIVLSGPNVVSQHCRIENQENMVTLHPTHGALCLVDNFAISEPTELTQGCVIQLASHNLFRYNNPAEAARLQSQGGSARKSIMLDVVDVLAASTRRPHVSISGELSSTSHSSLGSESEEDMTQSMRTRKHTISSAQKQLQQEKETAQRATEEAERVKQELERLKSQVTSQQKEQSEALRAQLQHEHDDAKAAEEAARQAREELQQLQDFIRCQRTEFEEVKRRELLDAQEKAQESAAVKARLELEELRKQLLTSQQQEKQILEERLQKEHSQAEAAQMSATRAAEELEQLRQQLSSKHLEAETMKTEIDQRGFQAAEASKQAQAAQVELDRVRNDFASKEHSEMQYQERLRVEQEEVRKAAQRAEDAQSQFAQMQEEFARRSAAEEQLREQYQQEQKETSKAAEAASTAQAELEKMRLHYEQQLEDERRRREAQEESEREKRELEKEHLRQEEERQRLQLAERQHEIENLKSQLHVVTQESSEQQRAHSEQLKQRGREEEARLHQQEEARRSKEEELRKQLLTSQQQEKQILEERLQKEHSQAEAAQMSATRAAEELEQLRQQLNSKHLEAETMKNEIDQRGFEAAEAAMQAQAAQVELDRVRNDFTSKEHSEMQYQERLRVEQEEVRKAAQRAEDTQSQFAQMQEEFARRSAAEEQLREQYQQEQKETSKAAEAASTAQAELKKMRLHYEQQLEDERRRREAQEESEREKRELEKERLRQEEERQRLQLAERQHEIENLKSQLHVVTQESSEQQRAHSEQLKQREREEQVRLRQQEEARRAKEGEFSKQLATLEEKQRKQEEERKRMEERKLAEEAARTRALSTAALLTTNVSSPNPFASPLNVAGSNFAADSLPMAADGIMLSPIGSSAINSASPVCTTPVPANSHLRQPLVSSQSIDDFSGFANSRVQPTAAPVVNGLHADSTQSPFSTPNASSPPLHALAATWANSESDNHAAAASPGTLLDLSDSDFRPGRQSDLIAFSVTAGDQPSSPLSVVDEFDPLADVPAPTVRQQPWAQGDASATAAASAAESNGGSAGDDQSLIAVTQPEDSAEEKAKQQGAAERQVLEDDMRRTAEAAIRQLAADQKDRLRRELQQERQEMSEDLRRREQQVEKDRQQLKTSSMARPQARGDCDLKLYLSVERGHNLEVTRKVEIAGDNTCVGYMVKQGGRVKSWKKRYFVLNPKRRMLSYYSDHYMRDCKGLIYFDAFQRVYGSSAEKQTAQEYLKKQAPGTDVWLIYIQTNERLYLAKAPCGPAYAIWLDALQVACWR